MLKSFAFLPAGGGHIKVAGKVQVIIIEKLSL